MEEIALAPLLSLAFSTGLIATFNPCGFALLPAYLSYFVGLESSEERSSAYNVTRALIVGLTLTLGFLLVFGTIGGLTSSIISQGAVQDRLGWATFVIGILMIPLGIAMLAGFEPKLSLPRLSQGGTSRQLPSIFLFGVSFAIVSLGCTAPLFFATVVGSFTSRSLWDGILVFLAYGAGMSLIVMVLTVATALSRTEIAVAMRRILPHVNKISGGLLVVAGAFLIIYGWWEIQVLRGNFDTNWLVDQSLTFQSNVSNWIADVGELRLAVALLLLLSLVCGTVVGRLVIDSRARQASAGAEADITTGPASQDSMLRRWFWSVWIPCWLVVWLALEISYYDFELLLLPVWRSLIDIPSRVGGWFTEPGRWAVLFEIFASVIVAFFAWLRIRSVLIRRRAAGTDSGRGNGSGLVGPAADGSSSAAAAGESEREVVKAVSETASS